MKKKTLVKLLIGLILVIIVLICGYKYFENRYNNYQGTIASSSKSSKSVISTIKGIENMEKDIHDGYSTQSEETLKKDYDYAHSVNSQVVAWIAIPGTDINYPVLHGYKDSYYLVHNWKGQSFWNGCVALDYMNSSLQNNTKLIHGHNMLNGIMFSQLTKFGSVSFERKHDYVDLYNGQLGQLQVYKIFSSIYTQPQIQLELGNNTEEERYNLINRLLEEKNYATAEYNGGNILFLNTCLSNGTNKHIIVITEEVSS